MTKPRLAGNSSQPIKTASKRHWMMAAVSSQFFSDTPDLRHSNAIKASDSHDVNEQKIVSDCIKTAFILLSLPYY